MPNTVKQLSVGGMSLQILPQKALPLRSTPRQYKALFEHTDMFAVSLTVSCVSCRPSEELYAKIDRDYVTEHVTADVTVANPRPHSVARWQ